jgi:hypothetical protein
VVDAAAAAGSPSGQVLLVDGANVVGSRPDGWWRDRAGAAARLHEQLLALAEPAVLVLEGAARAGVPEGESGGVRVVHAAGSGDDLLAGLASPRTLLVSADRELRDRCAQRGAASCGPRELLDRLPVSRPGEGRSRR